MSLAKRRKNLFVFFLVACLVLTTTLGAAPNLSQAKKKKQGITVTNKMTKGVLVIREKKKLQLKLKCQTAHCGRYIPHFDFGAKPSPIVPYRHLPQSLSGMTADCRSLV